jgi:hypothetical protein
MTATDPNQTLNILVTYRKVALAMLLFSAVSLATESIALTDRESLTENQSAALDAAVEAVISAGFDPETFRARVSCATEACEVDVFPEELETDEYASSRGCPLKYCATIVFSTKSNEIVKTTHWR